MSLRTKFMLALLLTALVAVAMVGGLAYAGMTRKVDSIRRESAAAHFHGAVTDYLQKYGSWRAGEDAEPFDRFMSARKRDERPFPPPPRREDGQRPPPDEERHPPPPGPDDEPHYRFILADQDFRVLLGAGVYRHDELLPETARKQARPVTVDGRIVAYVSPKAC